MALKIEDIRLMKSYFEGVMGRANHHAEKELLREKGKSISANSHPRCDMPEIFEYKSMVVCVTPGGDDNAKILENNRYFKSKKCNVAITATRCKGGSVEELQKFAKSEDVEIERVQKSYEYNLSKETQTLCNKEMAEVILGMI